MRTRKLTNLQVDVMNVLWRQGEATVAQVHAAMQEKRHLAMTTVATVLSRLEKRGLLKHRSEGRQYIYRAVVTEPEVREQMLSEITDRLFHGDVTELVTHLISEKGISSGDLARVKALIEESEKTSRKKRTE